MIRARRGVLVSLFVVSALGGCKTPDSGSGWQATAGSGSAIGDGSSVAGGSAMPELGSAAPDRGAAITRPFLYKVEKAGKASFLMGTWHVGVDAEKQLPPAVWVALATAEVFAMEVDPADPAGLAAFMRTDGRTLEDDLGPEYWARLEALMSDDSGKRHLPLLPRMKPFAAAVVVQLKDLPDTAPMDLVLAGKARDRKAEIVFLEPAMLQFRVLERWIDLRMLKYTIDELRATQVELEEAMVAYLAGDEAALAAAAVDRDAMRAAGFTESEIDLAMNQILYDRNEAWIPTLEQLFGKGDAFVAVGAGHLIGARSVVELLQAKGYTVTRVGG